MSQNNEEVEEEILYNKEECYIKEPFDIRSINIFPKTLTISNLSDRLRDDEIILDPEYQRNPNLWGDKEQSRLIESLIILVPLPTFYFDQSEDEKYEVIDGIQRLTAIKRFIVEDANSSNKLRLKNLEYLHDLEGLTYEELPRSIQRRINEQNVIAYVIGKGTDNKIKESIFTRINTGGLSLTRAEIRNALYRGKAASLVKELATSSEFIKATRGSVKNQRMLDREFVTRFFAFYLLDVNNFIGRFEEFLSAALEYIRNSSDESIREYRNIFIDTMSFCYSLFGDSAFRRISENGKTGVINKPLFDAVSVSLARLGSAEKNKILEHKESFLKRYRELFNDDKFRDVISNATATKSNIEKRYEMIQSIVEETLND